MEVQLRGKGRGDRGQVSTALFENRKVYFDFGEKILIASIFGLNFLVKRKLCSCVVFYLCFWRNVYRSALVPPNLPALKTSGCTPAFRYYSFCKMLHIKYLTVFWIRLYLDKCSVICTVTLSYILHQTHSEFWHIQSSIYSGIYSDISKDIQHY